MMISAGLAGSVCAMHRVPAGSQQRLVLSRSWPGSRWVVGAAAADVLVDGLLGVGRRLGVVPFVLAVALSGFETENLQRVSQPTRNGLPDAAAGTFLGGTLFLALGVAGLGRAYRSDARPAVAAFCGLDCRRSRYRCWRSGSTGGGWLFGEGATYGGAPPRRLSGAGGQHGPGRERRGG
jgi:hypothetical protein